MEHPALTLSESDAPSASRARSAHLLPGMSVRRAMQVFLLALAGISLLGIFALLGAQIDERILGSSATLVGFCLQAFLLALVADRWGAVLWMRVGLATAAIAMIGVLLLIWLDGSIGWRGSQQLAQAAFAFGLMAAGCVYFGAILGPRTGSRLERIVQRGCVAIVGFWLAVAVVTLLAPDSFNEMLRDLLMPYTEWIARVGAASAILGALGTLAFPVLLRLRTTVDATAEGTTLRTDHVRVTLLCPRCGAQQLLAANMPCTCAACGLALRVTVQEPRCTCGYLYFRLASGACPECGRPVPASARWNAQGSEAGMATAAAPEGAPSAPSAAALERARGAPSAAAPGAE